MPLALWLPSGFWLQTSVLPWLLLTAVLPLLPTVPPLFADAMWAANRLDIEATLRHVCKHLLQVGGCYPAISALFRRRNEPHQHLAGLGCAGGTASCSATQPAAGHAQGLLCYAPGMHFL